MPKERFMADGRERLMESKGYRTARAEVIATVRARYSEDLASAGVFRRLVLRLRMEREIAREVARLAPPEALYLQSTPLTRIGRSPV
jgi:hypothetical protein